MCIIEPPLKMKIYTLRHEERHNSITCMTPLNQFGINFYPKYKTKLPLFIQGSDFIRPINYEEKKGSAQCKSLVMLAALLSPGITKIKAKKSRNHTEILFKYTV